VFATVKKAYLIPFQLEAGIGLVAEVASLLYPTHSQEPTRAVLSHRDWGLRIKFSRIYRRELRNLFIPHLRPIQVV